MNEASDYKIGVFYRSYMERKMHITKLLFSRRNEIPKLNLCFLTFEFMSVDGFAIHIYSQTALLSLFSQI